jgi:hypothetical protein
MINGKFLGRGHRLQRTPGLEDEEQETHTEKQHRQFRFHHAHSLQTGAKSNNRVKRNPIRPRIYDGRDTIVTVD